MGKVKIITDSAVDMNHDLFQRYDIDILNLPITDGKQEYAENVNITPDELYNNMTKGVVYKTSQVNAYELKDLMTKYIKEDRPTIFISLSSGISGGYASCKPMETELQEEYPDAKIFIGNSLCAASGQTLMVLRCAMLAQDGADFEEIKEAFEYYQKHQEHLWTITNFEYLLRGGRISKAKAVMGGVLNIRPIMDMDKKKGTLELVDKARGEKNLMKKIIENAVKKSSGSFDPNQTVVIGYGQNMELKNALKEEVIRTLNVKEENILELQLGCLVGSHIGPDYTGFYFLNETRKNKYDYII